MKCFLLFVSLFSLYAGADSFKLAMFNIPQNQTKLCDDYAYDWGRKLQSYAGVTVTDARCVVDDITHVPGSWDIQITYDAPKKLQTVSTWNPGVIEHPGYAKREACEAALSAQAEKFAYHTKLQVFNAYCRVPYQDNWAWDMEIIGVGDAEIKPFTTGVRLYGKLVGVTKETFTEMVRKNLSTMVAEVYLLNFRPDFIHQALSANYYGKTQLDFDSTRIAYFATQAACLQEVASATQALYDAGVVNIGVYCQAGTYSQIELAAIRDEKSKLTLSVADKAYGTYEACSQQKAATIEHYRNVLNRDIKGAYCSIPQSTKKGFQVLMIEKK